TITLVFGKHYGPAVSSAQILMFAGLFQGLNAVLGNSLRGRGRPSLPAVAEGAGAVLTVLLLYILLPRLGIVGAAIASVAAYLTVTLLEFGFVARMSGVTSRQLAFAR